MPGVEVSTATRSGPATSLGAPSGQFFIAGITERGSVTTPVQVLGMADVSTLLGDRVTYGAVWDQLNSFFNEGGERAYVARVVGGAATVGTLSLSDRAVAPVPTLRVDAASPGAWATRVSVEVRDGGVTNTFRIIVMLDGKVVQDVSNLVGPLDAANKFKSSPYISVVNLGSASAAPTNNPAVKAVTVLSSGSDDRAAVTATDYIDALDLFAPGLGDGAVAVPGQTGTTVWNGIIAHCELNQRIALLASAQGETVANLIDQASAVDSEYAGLFTPWLQVSDGGSGIRTISPEGFVAAKRSIAHAKTGPWRAPAGEIGMAVAVLGLDKEYNAVVGKELDDAKVNVIRNVSNTVRLYGWRSLSNDFDDYSYLKDRDLLNRLVVQAEAALEQFVFAPIDRKGQLFSAINAELVGMVEPIRTAGGLYELLDDAGNLIDPGYKVETGNSMNTSLTLANNEVHARLSVRITPVGSLVILEIVKIGLLSGM